MTGPKIPVSVDVSGVKRELESLDQMVVKINGRLGSGEVGIDTAEAKRELEDLAKTAKTLQESLDQIGAGGLGDLGADEVALALERAATAAQTMDAVIRHTSGGDGLGGMANNAKNVDENLKRATRTQQILAREGIKLSRQQALAAKESFDKLKDSGGRGTRVLRSQEFDDWVADGWKNYSVNDREAARHRAEVLRRTGIDVPPGTPEAEPDAAPDAPGKRVRPGGRGRVGRMSGAAAGALGGIAAGMMGSGDGGMFSAAGNAVGTGLGAAAGFMLGGPLGAAVGAFAGQALGGVGSALDGGVQKVGDEGATYTDLRQSLGATSVDFDMLRGSVRHFTEGLGLAYNESAKLAAEFARTASLKGEEGYTVGREMKTSVGFGRGFGVSPGESVQFMATMRHLGVSGGDRDNRRLALMIGEAVNRGGTQGRMSEVLAAIQSFATSAARQSLTEPNVGSYTSFMSSMTGLNLHGMKGDPGAAAATMGAADAAMRQGGAFGEASHNFSLGLWQRTIPGFNALDMDFVNEQGAFGSVASAFGKDSAAYKLAAQRQDYGKLAAYDRMTINGGDKSILEHQMGALENQYGGDTDELRNAIQAHFGVGAGQASALYQAYKSDGGLGSLQKELRSAGVDTDKMNTRQIASLSALSGGDRGALTDQASTLKKLTGSDKLTDRESAQLDKAVSDGSDEELRKVVLGLTATHDTSTDEGDQMRKIQTDMSNALQKLATELIPLTMSIKEGIVELVRMVPTGSNSKFVQQYDKEQAKLAAESDQAGRMDNDLGALRAKIEGFKEDTPEARKEKGDSLSSLLVMRAEAEKRGDDTSGYDAGIKAQQASIRAGSEDGKRDLIEEHNKLAVERNRISSVPGNYSMYSPDTGEQLSAPEPQEARRARPGMELSDDEKKYLAETDRLIGAKPGTSQAQIQVESGNDPEAVSPAGARGLAQFMPTTLKTWEQRLGRKLESRQDQLLAHRLQMQENMETFGNVPDALRAYNNGPKRDKWNNPETAAYAGKVEATREILTDKAQYKPISADTESPVKPAPSVDPALARVPTKLAPVDMALPAAPPAPVEAKIPDYDKAPSVKVPDSRSADRDELDGRVPKGTNMSPAQQSMNINVAVGGQLQQVDSAGRVVGTDVPLTQTSAPRSYGMPK